MNPNIGRFDRVFRISVGVVLIALALSQVIGWWGYIGIVLLLTGIFSFCPLYRVLHITSCSREQ